MFLPCLECLQAPAESFELSLGLEDSVVALPISQAVSDYGLYARSCDAFPPALMSRNHSSMVVLSSQLLGISTGALIQFTTSSQFILATVLFFFSWNVYRGLGIAVLAPPLGAISSSRRWPYAHCLGGQLLLHWRALCCDGQQAAAYLSMDTPYLPMQTTIIVVTVLGQTSQGLLIPFPHLVLAYRLWWSTQLCTGHQLSLHHQPKGISFFACPGLWWNILGSWLPCASKSAWNLMPPFCWWTCSGWGRGRGWGCTHCSWLSIPGCAVIMQQFGGRNLHSWCNGLLGIPGFGQGLIGLTREDDNTALFQSQAHHRKRKHLLLCSLLMTMCSLVMMARQQCYMIFIMVCWILICTGIALSIWMSWTSHPMILLQWTPPEDEVWKTICCRWIKPQVLMYAGRL